MAEGELNDNMVTIKCHKTDEKIPILRCTFLHKYLASRCMRWGDQDVGREVE